MDTCVPIMVASIDRSLTRWSRLIDQWVAILGVAFAIARGDAHVVSLLLDQVDDAVLVSRGHVGHLDRAHNGLETIGAPFNLGGKGKFVKTCLVDHATYFCTW